MRRHLLHEKFGDAVIWQGCRSVGTELWRPPAELAQVTGARMEAEGKTGHVASSFCFLFSLWSIAVVD
ncbi:hypothetical protein GQ55_7G301100 [Panicum hallii var. hallii]|uniref:Uncharacterized protein n=1 Tax=Panicum hallii var. hallii TaxID=1504633 RepID=A0A2T7D0J7_9POAL|nr:hypothetical protein GQ55_7G301100 [Panicum hallii var. hallii]